MYSALVTLFRVSEVKVQNFFKNFLGVYEEWQMYELGTVWHCQVVSVPNMILVFF